MNPIDYFTKRNIGEPSSFCFRNVFNHFAATKDDCLRFDKISMDTTCYAGAFSSPSIGSLLAYGLENGIVAICDTSKKDFHQPHQIKKWQAHNNAIFDVHWAPNQPMLATASGDTSVAVWDLPTLQRTLLFRGHKSSVKSVSFQPLSTHVLCSSSRDGRIIIWDSRNFKKGCNQSPDIILEDAHEGQISTPLKKKRHKDDGGFKSTNSVTKVDFISEYKILSVGACDRAIKVWDIRRITTKNKAIPLETIIPKVDSNKDPPIGYTHFSLNSTRSQAFASSCNSGIFQINLLTNNKVPIQVYSGHKGNSNYCKTNLSPDDQFLISGSVDSHVYMWQVGCSLPLLYLQGHGAEVTSVLWNPNRMDEVISLSDDLNSFRWTVYNKKIKRPFGVTHVWKAPLKRDSSTRKKVGSELEGEENRRDENSGPDRRIFHPPEQNRVLEPITNSLSSPGPSTSTSNPSRSATPGTPKAKSSAGLITNFFSPK